jgi:non-specific serine/threonine protein kinase
MVRLPWTVPRPIAEPLRAIVNRATDRQERQRYRNARTFERALEGWLQASNEQDAGPITLLLGRMRSVGLLPAMPGGADRAARLALMENGHTSELSSVVLQDFALSFELVRMVNFAQSKAGHTGSGAVLAIHRAIAMVGLDGVRQAALSLRPWPGPLNDEAANALHALMQRVKRAGAMARALQPAGYDQEVVYLITALQNLGWLVVQYHFPDEAAQIRRLMLPSVSPKAGEPDEQGMTAEGASFAVLGIDIDALGSAVMHHWGLDDGVQHMVRRAPPTGPIHTPTSDVDMLRLVASCANEVLDAVALPPRQAIAAVQRVAQRYGRALNITLKDIQDALQPPAAATDRAVP